MQITQAKKKRKIYKVGFFCCSREMIDIYMTQKKIFYENRKSREKIRRHGQNLLWMIRVTHAHHRIGHWTIYCLCISVSSLLLIIKRLLWVAHQPRWHKKRITGGNKWFGFRCFNTKPYAMHKNIVCEIK